MYSLSEHAERMFRQLEEYLDDDDSETAVHLVNYMNHIAELALRLEHRTERAEYKAFGKGG